jgi:hypothetical protein
LDKAGVSCILTPLTFSLVEPQDAASESFEN